jgi:dnd system-associated protein 4
MSVGARDTINIDESVHEIYKQLTEGNDPVNAPFKTMKDVFLWAACLGFEKNNRKRLGGKKVIIFRWAQFNQQIDIPMIKAISLSEIQDPHVLINQDELIEIIEEYANGAILDLQSITQRQGGQPLYNFVGEILESI